MLQPRREDIRKHNALLKAVVSGKKELDEKAIDTFVSLARESGLLDAWWNLGLLFEKEGDFVAARYCYLQLTDDAMALYRLGVLHEMCLDQPMTAIESYLLAAQHDHLLAKQIIADLAGSQYWEELNKASKNLPDLKRDIENLRERVKASLRVKLRSRP